MDSESEILGRMRVSIDKGLVKQVDVQRVRSGSHFTECESWLREPVADFLKLAVPDFSSATVLDPFAGEGHLFLALNRLLGFGAFVGLDLYAPGWLKNDSLVTIPACNASLICTNPPYLAKYSAKRKGVWPLVEKYFLSSSLDDLYLIALERMLETRLPVVAIVPETFISSGKFRERLERVVVLEKANPFKDTDVPVCVACFSAARESGRVLTRYYKDDAFEGDLPELLAASRVKYSQSSAARISFNRKDGLIALKAVDGTAPDDRIRFMSAQDFGYDSSNIKVSSRLMTKIAIDGLRRAEVDEVVVRANAVLEDVRARCKDAALSPFKGNNKSACRRRRLDYGLARGLLANALTEMESFGDGDSRQRTLFEMS